MNSKPKTSLLAPAFTWFERVAVVLFLTMVFVAQLRVVGRFVPRSFPIQFIWAAELATLLLMATVFLGFAIVAIRNENITITIFRDIIIDRLPARLASAYRLLLAALSLVVITVVVYASYEATVQGWSDTLFYTIPEARRGHIYLLMTAVFLLAGLKIVADIRRELVGEGTMRMPGSLEASDDE